MHKKTIIIALFVTSALFVTISAQACEKCLNEFTTRTTCWTLQPADYGQTRFGACWVEEIFDSEGNVASKYCDGSAPPEECSNTGGGSDGPHDPDDQVSDGDLGDCRYDVGCPAYCISCS